MEGREFSAVYPVELEMRQRRRGGRELRGRFRYGDTATVRNRGRVRKERFGRGAFRYTVSGAGKSREVNLLVGHNYGAPLASRGAGTLELAETDDALEFRADLPGDANQPTWMRDAVLAVDNGLMRGLSPGFIVPPLAVRPSAERLVPEPGNEGVDIRVIEEAVLLELSVVARPAYKGAAVDIRAAELDAAAWEALFGSPKVPEPPDVDRRREGRLVWL